jgi:hypothetical protein
MNPHPDPDFFDADPQHCKKMYFNYLKTGSKVVGTKRSSYNVALHFALSHNALPQLRKVIISKRYRCCNIKAVIAFKVIALSKVSQLKIIDARTWPKR